MLDVIGDALSTTTKKRKNYQKFTDDEDALIAGVFNYTSQL